MSRRAPPPSSSDAARRVVASTAGIDSWKTWAGRQHGSNDDFELLDLWRGLKLTVQHKLGHKGKPPPVGTACPVCLTAVDEVEEERKGDNEASRNVKKISSKENRMTTTSVATSDGSRNKWHVTWCGCAVCKECMKCYVQSQIRDAENTNDVLKCPVCSNDLRKVDAVMALGGDEQLISEWDAKIRNNLLRALPNYRPCPRCTSHRSKNDENSNFDKTYVEGGGFVTPECLAPHYNERLSDATKVIQLRYLAPLAVLLSYLVFVRLITKTPSKSPLVDLFFMLAPIFNFLKIGLIAQLWVATKARCMFFRPIQVSCPCCNEQFILPAEANSKIYDDEQTNEWMKSNTRQCPSCSVPISKVDGCNHMKCSHCSAQFCWACMRLRTSCRAYRCNNRAPFGDAIPTFEGGERYHDGRNRRRRRNSPQPSDSVLTVIDYMLDQPCPQIGYKDGVVLGICILARHLNPMQILVHSFMSVFSSVLFTNTILGLGVGYMLRVALRDFHQHHLRHRRHPHGHVGPFFPVLEHRQQQQQVLRRQNNPYGNLNDMRLIRQLDQDLISEALRRSMEDQ